MILRTILVWIILAVLAIANGLLRNSIISPWIGELGGHIISTIILCIMIFIVTLTTISWINPQNRRGALAIGLFWLFLTVCFEFLAGHYVFGNSWDKLIADYNIFRGRVWIAVLAVTVLAPRWAYIAKVQR